MSDERILVFDVETTGTDKRRDQVIELCAMQGLGDSATSQTWRIRPSVPMSPGAQAVHGISMDDLKDCPTFAEIADDIRTLLEESEVWVGYNVTFDIEMIQAEFKRLGQPEIRASAKVIVDPFRLWQQSEPRTLRHAHLRFVGKDFESAHSAQADVEATGRVLEGMMKSFEIKGSWAEVASLCEPDRGKWIGPSRHLQWSEQGEPTIAFGKHSGQALSALARGSNSGYLQWVLQKDFPAHVHRVCEQALNMDSDAFLSWTKSHYASDSQT